AESRFIRLRTIADPLQVGRQFAGCENLTRRYFFRRGENLSGVLQNIAGEPGINHVPVLYVVIAKDTGRDHKTTEDRAEQNQSVARRPESFLYADAQGFSNGLKSKCLLLSLYRIDADSYEKDGQTATSPSGQGFVFAGWREMQIHMIKKEIDRHAVVNGNGHLAGGGNDFDVVARGRYVQVLNGFEDAFADLLFGLMLDNAKSR